MSELTTVQNSNSNIAAFDPNKFEQCMKIAQVMAKAQLVPVHLQNKPSDCFIVAQQAMGWGMDPFAVAQCTSVVRGKICYEGKLVAGVIEALAGVKLSYEYSGQGEGRTVEISGVRKNETEPCKLQITLKDVKTDNQFWKKSSDQMLAYRGAREWARRYTPAVLLGIYTEDEFDNVKDVTPANNSKLAESIKNNDIQEEAQVEQVSLVDDLFGEVELDPKTKKFNEIIEQINACETVECVTAVATANKSHLEAFDKKQQDTIKALGADKRKELGDD